MLSLSSIPTERGHFFHHHPERVSLWVREHVSTRGLSPRCCSFLNCCVNDGPQHVKSDMSGAAFVLFRMTCWNLVRLSLVFLFSTCGVAGDACEDMFSGAVGFTHDRKRMSQTHNMGIREMGVCDTAVGARNLYWHERRQVRLQLQCDSVRAI